MINGYLYGLIIPTREDSISKQLVSSHRENKI